MTIKQVIVMRSDLNMPKGKLVAQGAHASMSFITRALVDITYDYGDETHALYLSETQQRWLSESFIKICLKVNSEEELLVINDAALEAGLTCHLITDDGRTMFDGVPTHTCVAIGPAEAERIDPITAHLKLL